MKLIAATAFALAIALGSTVSMAENGQQEKMKSCNAEATAQGKKGDDRRTFMSSCLSNKPAAAAEEKKLTAQQSKMKTCNDDATAKGLKGADRKTFMSTCLKG